MGKRFTMGCFCLMFALVFLSGCNRKDTDHLAKIGQIVANRGEQMVADMQDDFSEEWKNVRIRNSDRILSRSISSRLLSDKSLENCTIRVHAKDAVVELNGKVKSYEQRARAIDLAQSTNGVKKVDDNLQIVD